MGTMRVETKRLDDGRIVVALMGKTTWPKAHQVVKTEEEIARVKALYEEHIAEHEAVIAARKAERKAGREAVLAKGNPYKVGDVLRNSWGYDQTNVDFYEVIAVTSRTVTYRKIGASTVPGSEGFMSDKVVPTSGNFIGEAVTKNLQAYVGGAEPYIPVDHGCMSKVTPGDGAYRSWYA